MNHLGTCLSDLFDDDDDGGPNDDGDDDDDGWNFELTGVFPLVDDDFPDDDDATDDSLSSLNSFKLQKKWMVI